MINVLVICPYAQAITTVRGCHLHYSLVKVWLIYWPCQHSVQTSQELEIIKPLLEIIKTLFARKFEDSEFHCKDWHSCNALRIFRRLEAISPKLTGRLVFRWTSRTTLLWIISSNCTEFCYQRLVSLKYNISK